MPNLPPRVSAVLFDLDGTLLHTSPDLVAAADAALAECGLAGIDSALIESMVGRGVDELVRRCLRHLRRADNGAEFEQLLAAYMRHYEACNGDHASLYPGVERGVINSIHHQGIQDLAPGFTVEARCPDDGMVEAIRREGAGYVAAVQWHPEFHRSLAHDGFDDTPMLTDFLAAARAARRR